MLEGYSHGDGLARRTWAISYSLLWWLGAPCC